jgi:hypothetical protein
MAEIADGEKEAYVDKLDVEGLSARNQIFLVTAAGNGHCLGLYVFVKQGVSSFTKVWSPEETPKGGGFCRGSPNNPQAYVTRGGKIQVEIDYADFQRLLANKETEYFTYAWNGKAYRLVSHRRLRNPRPEKLGLSRTQTDPRKEKGRPAA